MPDFATVRARLALVGVLVHLFVAVLFALQNTQPIRVNLLFASTEGSAALVLVCTFTIGVLVGVLALTPSRLRDRSRIKQLRNELNSQNTSPGEASGRASAEQPDANTE
jgi:putative membrane protein